MNLRIIGAMLKKDLALFRSNRFYMLITVIGIVFYIAIYFLLPSDVEEDLNVAIYAPALPPAFTLLTEEEGLATTYYFDEESMKKAVEDGDYQVAIALPADIMDVWSTGGQPEIKVYYSSGAMVEVKDAIVTLLKELSYIQTGQALNVETTEEILGPDMLGDQVALRDRMRPLLAVFILLVEILTLASLISTEIEQGTARALLVTPVRVSGLFISKGILGVGLALLQAILFMLIVGGFNHQPLIILTTLLIGSVMVVGIGFLLASITRDVMAVTGWGILILIILAIPGFGITIPGLLSSWARVIPSYYLTDTVNRVANYGAGWSDIGLNLAILAGASAVFIWGGMEALRRRYR